MHDFPDMSAAKDMARNEISNLIDEMNAKYAVVNEAGKAVIYCFRYDAERRRNVIDRMSPRDLSILYQNKRYEIGKNKDGEPKHSTASNLWLNDVRRREYMKGVVFDPSGKSEDPEILNLWRGFAFTPKEGDWSLLRQHMKDIVCWEDEQRFDYLLNWMARAVQRPAEQGDVAVVMKGGEGTGKGVTARAMKALFGQHGLHIMSSRHLTGNFNAHLRDVVCLFADEAFFAGDRAHVGTLKGLITEPCLTIESKGIDAVEMPNFLHIMMASNEERVIPASLDARRFFVLEVSEAKKRDYVYFEAIQVQMDNGGYAAMLHDLLARDLSRFNVRAFPATEALQTQRKLSLPTAEAWWKDCLQREYIFKSKLGLEEKFSHWEETISTELLYASYMEFANGRHDRHPMHREQFGKFMLRMGCKAQRLTNAATGERIGDEPNPYGGTSRKAMVFTSTRPPGYHLGTSEAARRGFSTVTGLEVKWEEEDSPQDAP